MIFRPDWKFSLGLLVSLAGVILPFGLWHADQSSKELQLTINSITGIQPEQFDHLNGIKLSVDGKQIKSPYISVLELSNTGLKTIQASDFEGPIRIVVDNPARIVKKLSIETGSKSLEPKIELVDDSVQIQPLLLNSGDTIRLTLISENVMPEYSARSRIAGITEISTRNAQSTRLTRRYWISRITSALLFIIYILNMSAFAVAVLRQRKFMASNLFTGLISCMGVVISFDVQNNSTPLLRPESDIPLAIAALVSAFILMKRQIRQSIAISRRT